MQRLFSSPQSERVSFDRAGPHIRAQHVQAGRRRRRKAASRRDIHGARPVSERAQTERGLRFPGARSAGLPPRWTLGFLLPCLSLLWSGDLG